MELDKLKNWSNAIYCASGYLRPPTHMLQQPGYVLPLVDYYSAHVGLLPFACTPYMSHHSFYGYLCAQAAVYLALEMMLPLGAIPHSPATLTHIASMLGTRDHGPRPQAWLCADHKHEKFGGRDGYFCRGLDSNEIGALLSDGELGTRGLTQDFALDGTAANRLVGIHLSSMLLSRIPVIALVEYNTMAEGLGHTSVFPQPEGHVITIIGLSVPASGELGVVFHDGHLGPYREMSMECLLAACRAFPNEKRQAEQAILLLSPFPTDVNPQGYQRVFREATTVPEADVTVRLTSSQTLDQYLTRFTPGHKFFRSVSKLVVKTPGSDRPLWAVEYRLRRTQGIYVDLIDATTDNPESRIGIVCLGSQPLKDCWWYVPAPEQMASIEKWFVNEVDGVKEKNGTKIERE